MIGKLMDELQTLASPHTFNPYVHQAPDDKFHDGAVRRLERLTHWLEERPQPRYIFVGEAPGWRGARMTGLPFTAEIQLGYRISTAARPYAEATATTFWEMLGAYQLTDCVAWNAFPLHPHRPGWHDSNRTPTHEEIRQGRRSLEILLEGYASAKVVAIGRKAEIALNALKCYPTAVLRHPAHGGAAEFRAGVKALSRGRDPGGRLIAGHRRVA